MLSVITKSVTFCISFAECHYVEFPYAECRYAKCHYANAIIATLRLKNSNNLSPPIKGAKTLSMMTFSITTLSFTDLFVTLGMYDTRHKRTSAKQHCSYVEFHDAECY
jgi:hypothetical protein